MFTKKLSLLLVVVMLITAVPFVYAQDQSTIVEIAVNDGRFDTLVAAVTATGLADALSGGEWTVFAPTDDAFAKLGLDASNVASAFSKAELTDILLYHALGSEVTSAKALTLLGDVTMANGKLAGLKYFDGSLYVNDDAKVIIPDIDASNGVIHVVDTVILGPWPRTADAPAAVAAPAAGGSIVEISVNDGRFDIRWPGGQAEGDDDLVVLGPVIGHKRQSSGREVATDHFEECGGGRDASIAGRRNPLPIPEPPSFCRPMVAKDVAEGFGKRVFEVNSAVRRCHGYGVQASITRTLPRESACGQ